MENIKAISILMIVLGVVLVVISISGCINDKEDMSDYPKTVKSMSDSEINNTIAKVRASLQNGDKYDIDIKKGPDDDSPLSLYVRQTIYNRPTTFGNNITLDEAREIAINFIKEHKDIFTIYDGEEIKISKVRYNNRTEVFDIEFAPHEYKGILLYPKSNGLGMSLYKDGRIKTVGGVMFKNVSVPTSPKITDDQMKNIISKKFNVSKDKVESEEILYIYPKYHPNQQFWSYHLIRQCLDRENLNIVVIDTITGDIISIEKIIVELPSNRKNISSENQQEQKTNNLTISNDTHTITHTIKLSKEEAIKKAQEIANLSKIGDVYIKEAKLEKLRWGNEWRISMSKEPNLKYVFFDVFIDAETGELVFYYVAKASTKKVRIPEDELLRIANEFFNKYDITIPNDAKFKGIKYSIENTSATLSWEREVNGIRFPLNDIELTVLSDGTVDSYSKIWDKNISIQQPKITEKDAQETARKKLSKIYAFKKEPKIEISELEYSPTPGKSGIFLCYYIVLNDGQRKYGAKIDAQTGELLWHDYSRC